MQTKKEISEKIGLLNLKILSASKELEELEQLVENVINKLCTLKETELTESKMYIYLNAEIEKTLKEEK